MITAESFAYVALHQQALAWAVGTGVELVQRAATRCCCTGVARAVTPDPLTAAAEVPSLPLLLFLKRSL